MGIQDYFRMQSVFGKPNVRTPSYLPEKSQRDIFGSNTVRQPDEQMYIGTDEGESDSPAQDAFRESVLNPPQYQRPGIGRTLMTGALSALQGSNEPDQDAKTRVMVDGQAYQKRGVMTDADGTKRYVGGTKPRGFWESLGNKPFDTEQAGAIMNMPNEQRLADWKLKTGGLKEAATLENKDEVNRALAAQRYANAAAIPQRIGQGDRKLDQTADQNEVKNQQNQQRIDLLKQKQDHVASRQDLSESEKAALTNKYRQEQITLQGEIQKSLQGTRGEQRLEQIDASGDIQKDIQELRGTQASQQIGERGEQSRETAAATGEEARKTKAIPPGGAGATSQLPTQQKVQLQLKASKAKQEHPEWNKYIKTGADGMIEITPPSTGGWGDYGKPDKATYDAIVTYMGGESASTMPSNTSTPSPPKEQPKPAPKEGQPVEAGRVKVYDMAGRVVATIPAADVKKLNKKKYSTTKPK